MKTKEDKRMFKLEYFVEIALFWGYIRKISTFTFWCMVILLVSYNYGLNLLVRGPKAS
jgi:hypothetical protein